MTYMAIPNIGNYTIALATAVESLGIKAWASTATTPEALKLGIAAAPETVCLPLKAHLGHFIEADRAGVEYAFMVNSVGTCRLRYYRHMIEHILKDLGLKIKIFGLGFDGFKPPIVRHFDPGPITFLKPLFHTVLKIKNIEYILGSQGIELKNFFLLGEELKNITRIVFLNQNKRKYLSKIADRYLRCTVGGHALDSVAHSIHCADEGYDGMIHLCPSGCMPEVSVRPILKRVSKDKDFPILEMSYDEHTCGVGIATRMEAFADVLIERRKKVNK